MSNTTNTNYEDKRVTILDGNNRKLDVSDKLEKSDNWRRPLTDKSKLCITICDYTNKDKGGSVTAKFNFTVNEIAEFNFMMGFAGDFTKSYDRIFNSPDDKGLSPVKRIMISRQAKMQDGSPSKYPIYIRIENGRAKCNVNDKGMTSFTKNTYVCDQKADIRLSYEDARTLFRESQEYIERMKTIYALELRGSVGTGIGNAEAEASEGTVSEKKFVDGVNCLYKAIDEKFKSQNEYFAGELEKILKTLSDIHEDIMFGK